MEAKQFQQQADMASLIRAKKLALPERKTTLSTTFDYSAKVGAASILLLTLRLKKLSHPL